MRSPLWLAIGLLWGVSSLAAGYDDLFPYYGEFCGLSQISKKKVSLGLDVQGGKGGHGLLYLKGACRDLRSPYPRLVLCDELPAAERPAETGVGVSVNSDFRNANWIAVQSREFFYRGGLGAEEALTRENYLTVRAEAERLELLRGVDFHPELFQKAPSGMSNREYMWEDTFGTDYAFQLGRESYCARVPLDRERTKKAVDYLNALNEKYRKGEEYKWSGFYDNCTHTSHNALAAAGVWAPYRTNASLPRQLFNLAIPLNEFATLMHMANDMPLDDPLALYHDRYLRRLMLQEGRLPVGPGALAAYTPVKQKNEIYNTELDALLLEVKLLRTVGRKIDRFKSEPRFTDLRANLEWYRERYKRAAVAPYPYVFGSEDKRPGEDYSELPRFYLAYQAHVKERLAFVEAALARLSEGEKK